MTNSADPGRAVSSAGAPAEVPPAPISAGRAYAEALSVFALVFAASIINAGEVLGGKVPAPTGDWGTFAPAAVQQVCDLILVSLVVIFLSARRGVTLRRLGVCLPAPRPRQPVPGAGGAGVAAPGVAAPGAAAPGAAAPGRASVSRGIRMAALGMLAFFAGGLVTTLSSMGHHLPQPAHPSVPYLVYSLSGALFSGVVEEMVALAFVVSTLRQARRPVAEIVAVAVLLRCSYHVYYGPGITGIAIWAAAFALLYLRFGSIVPLIVLHFFWDGFQFMALKWPAFVYAGFFAGLVLLITAVILWIVDTSARRAPLPYPMPYAQLPYPGPPPHPAYPAQPPYPAQSQYPAQGQPQYPAQGQPQYPAQGQPQYPAQGQPQPQYPGQAPYPGQPPYPGQAPYPGQPPYPAPPGYPAQRPYPAVPADPHSLPSQQPQDSPEPQQPDLPPPA